MWISQILVQKLCLCKYFPTVTTFTQFVNDTYICTKVCGRSALHYKILVSSVRALFHER